MRRRTCLASYPLPALFAPGSPAPPHLSLYRPTVPRRPGSPAPAAPLSRTHPPERTHLPRIDRFCRWHFLCKMQFSFPIVKCVFRPRPGTVYSRCALHWRHLVDLGACPADPTASAAPGSRAPAARLHLSLWSWPVTVTHQTRALLVQRYPSPLVLSLTPVVQGFAGG